MENTKTGEETDEESPEIIQNIEVPALAGIKDFRFKNSKRKREEKREGGEADADDEMEEEEEVEKEKKARKERVHGYIHR